MAIMSTCVLPILWKLVGLQAELKWILPPRSRDTILTLEKEMRFLKTFLVCMRTSTGIMPEAETIICRFEDAFDKANDDFGSACFPLPKKFSSGEVLQAVSHMLEMGKKFQPEIQEAYGILLKQSWQGNNQPDPECLVGLLDSLLLENLTDLVDSKDLSGSFQKQIQTLKKKLRFLRKFLAMTSKQSIPHQIMHSFLTYVHFSASSAAFWSYLCWAEGIEGEMEIKLSDLVQKIMPHTSELAEMYVELLKASKQAALSGDAKIDEVLASFAEFLSENSVSFMGKRAATIPENLIFLLSFIFDLQEECTGDLGQIAADIMTIAMEAGYLEFKYLADEAIYDYDQIMGRERAISKLFQKMKLIKAEILLIELIYSKDNLMVLMRDATAVFHEGLKFLKPFFFDPPVDRECLLKHVETVVSEVTCLIYSIHGKRFTKEMVTKMNLDLFWLLEKIKLVKAEIHLNELQTNEDGLLSPMKDKTEILYEGFRSLRAFLMDSSDSEENTENRKLFLTYLEAATSGSLPLNFTFHVNKMTEDLVDVYLGNDDAIANDSGSQNCSVGETMTQRDNAMQMHLVSSEVLQMFRLFKAHMRQIYLQDVNSLQSILPRTDDLGLITLLLQNLREILNNDAETAVSFAKHHLELVYGELEFFKSFLAKSMKQRNQNEKLRDLCTRTTRVAYEAECMIDSFVVRDGPLCYRVLWLSAVAEEIKVIKAKAMEIYDEEKYYNEVDNVDKASGEVPALASTPTLDEVVIGFNNEEEKINGLLTRGTTKKMDVVSIVGMPGLGKTTLAKKVYNSPSVASHFYARAWCCVSQVYERRQLLLDILGHIIEITDQIRRLDSDDMARKLYQCLKGRRYLIVMDDLWDIGAWRDLRESFPDDNNGSRVLFTSRKHDLGSQAKEDSKTFILSPLANDESWQLLQKKVFREEDCPPTLLEVGKRIAENCKGVPLSLVVIAGLLARTEKTPDSWKQFLEKLASYVVADSQGGCMHVLGLSYEHLPDQLKSCFLYFGAFPEDKEIPVWKLSSLWIAEGFVQSTDSKSLEDSAEYCLLELLSRSLVIVAKRRSNGRVKSCQVHDLLRELCLKKAKEENFLRLIHGYDEFFASSPDGFDYIADSNYIAEYEERRLCICSQRKHFTMLKPCGPRVRCLFFYATNDMNPRSHYDVSFIFHNFKIMRVLDMESINMGDSFPIGLEQLVQLKYLGVRGDVKSIPSSIAKLLKLETFLVKALRGEVLLPHSFWNMKRLRRVHINDRVAFSSQNDELVCFSLLQNIETFSTPALSYGGDTEKMLRRLPRLRKLRCMFVESSDYARKFNKFPALDFLTHLESLKIFYHGMVGHPCDQFNLPLNLRKLTLSKFRLPWSHISTIGRLPNLEVLKLLLRAFEGQSWEMRDGEFQSLKYLKLDNLAIAEWKASNDHLPCLKHLVLQRCKKLMDVPSSFGDIATLERIEVHWCSQSAAASVKKIEDELRDMGNEELEVLVSGMEE